MIQQNNILFNSNMVKPIIYDIGYQPTKKPKPIIIFAHGFKGFKDWGHFPLIMQHFIEHGFAFLKFNFSHNGGTVEQPIDFPDLEAFGENNISKEIADLNTVVNAIFNETIFPKEEVDINSISVIGHSRGGGITLLTTQLNNKIKKVVTWSAISDFEKRLPPNLSEWKNKGVVYIENARTHQQMPMYYQFVEDLMANKAMFSIKNAVKNIKIPQLIIHGTNDTTVLIEEAQQLKLWNPKATMHLIEGAEHTFGGKHPFESECLPKHTLKLVEATINFLESRNL